ncbi:hypothetical protein D3C75_1096050 [compost metagenome]
MYDCSNTGAVVGVTVPLGVIGLPLVTCGGTLPIGAMVPILPMFPIGIIVPEVVLPTIYVTGR